MMKNSVVIFILICFITCNNKKEIDTNNKFNIEEFITHYKYQENSNDSVLIKNIRNQIDRENTRYIVYDYGYLFKNNFKYLIILDQGREDTYYWFKKTKIGFTLFFKRDRNFPLVNDSIFDINYDGINELVIMDKRKQHPVQTSVYFLNVNGLIESSLDIADYCFSIGNNQFIQVKQHGSPYIYFSKCKWNKSKIDTLEKIVFDLNDYSKIYKYTNESPIELKSTSYEVDKSKISEKLNNLPPEYLLALKKYDANLFTKYNSR